MKKLSIFVLFCAALFFSSCGDDAAPTGGDPFGGGGGGGGGTVTITVALVQDAQQNYHFQFTPSAAVTVNTVTANCAAAGVSNAQVQGDGTTVFNNTSPFTVGPVTGLAAGQVWTFTVTGKLGSSTGTAYTTNTNFTVQ